MIFCKELNKEFATKQEMFTALMKERETIIGLKKAAIKNSDPVLFQIRNNFAIKAEGTDEPIKIGDFVYPVINTTNYLDSHGDVHIDSIWDVSIKDQKNKLYYIINHELEIGKVISYPQDTEAMVKAMAWAELGLSYSGTTQALIFKVKLTEKSNPAALQAIIAKEALQNSVRMQYVSITLCIDDSSDDFKQEYANFYKYLAVIANKQDAMDAGYFWAVTEAKIVKEGSAVLFGSNDATPILYNLEGEKADPSADSQQENLKNDPSQDSQQINKNYLHFI